MEKMSWKGIIKMSKKIISESEHMPRYLTKKPDFSCPISPYILWNRKLKYATCPVNERERDMNECENCINKGNSTAKSKSSRKRPRGKKNGPKVERKNEVVPKIGKTYTSE